MATAAAAETALEFDRAEQIVSQFFHKLLHAVIVSRITRIHSVAARSRGSERRKRDRWFHLNLGDLPASLIQHHHEHRHEHNHRPHHPAGGLSEPMVVDIVLTSLDGSRTETLVERWSARCEPHSLPGDTARDGSRTASSSSAYFTSSASSSCGRTYKNAMVMLRSLYVTLRLLPAYRVFQILRSAKHPYNYDIDYRVSSSAAPLSNEEVEAQRNYSFAPVETLFGQIIVSVQYRPSLADLNFEVASSTPPRIIPDYVDSLVTEPVRSFSSWPATGTSASGPLSSSQYHDLDSLPSRREDYGHILASATRHSRASLDSNEFRPSPSLSNSPTQSPPRHSLSMQGSPAKSRFSRKPETLRLGDIYANLHHYATRKGVKAGHADSGIYSYGSSSRYGVSSRLSVQDDPEDGDSYPFAVDDVNTSDSRPRNFDEKETPEFAISGKSQDADVGILVNMLKTAPPLRQDESSFRSSKSELKNSGTSSLILSRKTSDALEELQGYKDMKQSLLSRSEIKSSHSAEGKTSIDPSIL